MFSFHMPEYLRAGFDKYKYVLLVCAVGIVLALWPTGSGAKKESAASQDLAFAPDIVSSAQVEEKLEELLEKIEGVGRTKVMITVKYGYQPDYLYNIDSQKGGENQNEEEHQQVVIVGRNGNESPVISRVGAPEYLGAVILCDGADNPKLRLEVTQAVQSLTGITSERITISKMKK
ncbi:hypothetical protein [Acidaminobacterium chupaoyuni]